MPPLPKTTFVRWSQMIEWLGANGFTEYQVKVMIQEGVIPKRNFGKRAHYCPHEIAAKLNIPMPAEETTKDAKLH